MANSALVARSSFPDSIGPTRKTTKFSVFSRSKNARPWKPLALRTPILISIIAICWSLIAVLQFLLWKSEQNNGIMFAPHISDLPLSQTFLYLYFPTIVAVLFSIYWTWIDLETKRMEPYYQLSKENGALGKDSLLLHYPFDFIPLVPFKAFRDRHWPVFWASFAVVLVTWGIVPTQAGIFSTRTVTRTFNPSFSRSTAFVPASEQATTLNLEFANSIYRIATLNETLGQYMARNYTLVPVRPAFESSAKIPQFGQWSASTTMYSLDLFCEPAILGKSAMHRSILANSSNGCSFYNGLTGNITKGVNEAYGSEVLANKEFTGMFAPFWNSQGFADYSLDKACPITSNSTFYAAFQRNKAKDTDPPHNVTAIFCTPTYYQQKVMATIDAASLIPSKIKSVGEKEPIEANMFNSSWMEELMGTGSLGLEVRGDIYPSKSAPKYFELLAGTNLSLSTGPVGGGMILPMVGLAHALSRRPLEDYLDWKVLSKSYADAYRLMFARTMRDILDTKFSTVDEISGQIQVTTEAVVLEAVFVYIVEGLLGVVSLAAIALLYLSVTRKRNLRSNPSTIAALMGLVADNQCLLSDVEGLDCCTVEEMENSLSLKRFKLVDDGHATGIVELGNNFQIIDNNTPPAPVTVRRDTPSNIAKPVRPVEFSLGVAFPLISLFIALTIGLTIIFVKARPQGLPLPSSNTIVQNLLENYIPTAIATLIEPMWILFNRLLCMLQPIEELQGCNARGKNSIDLDYSSLPPQLVIMKALRSRHFVLAAVCAMALLANLLAVTFAGLFNQVTIDMQHATTLDPPFNFKFVPINGSIGLINGHVLGSDTTSGAYRGGTGEDHFLVADSYLRQGTALPAWTDKRTFYLPFFPEQENDNPKAHRFEAQTTAVGARLDCTSLEVDDNFRASLVRASPRSDSILPSINITINSPSGNSVRCTKVGAFVHHGPLALVTGSCVTGPSALELTFLLDPVANATQEERDVCMGSVVLGWIRDANGTCEEHQTVVLDDTNAAFVHCRPKLMTGSGTIQVDSSGRLQQDVRDLNMEDIGDGQGDVFSNDPINLIGQSNSYIFKQDSPGWHNDSFADGFFNYFVSHAGNGSRLVDPTKGLPKFDEIEGPLNTAYALLFAIWMGTNKNQLLIPHDAQNLPTLEGWRVEPETRLFVSTPMFAISEGILCTYTIVAIIVYMRRPGQYLARMPTSIASLIALFAASAAVLDMTGTSHLDKKGRARHLDEVDARYGYGSFIGGGDGRIHIGIEKSPFVRTRSKSTWFEKKVNSFRKDSAS